MCLGECYTFKECVPDIYHKYKYADFKGKTCAKTYKKKGCLSAERGVGGGSLLVNFRANIPWGKPPSKPFAAYNKALVCACAKAAKDANVRYFGIKYWGECWHMPDSEDLHQYVPGECKTGDGNYKDGCSPDAEYECNADEHHYYLYENLELN